MSTRTFTLSHASYSRSTTSRPKADILARGAEWGLRPDIVEKDYVLGWLLAAFAIHGVTSASWVFKGGTCLKKCFFETYRFSEDLDFSLRGPCTTAFLTLMPALWMIAAPFSMFASATVCT